ncbi:LADA_0F06546g1_1 [Lachancea dasiensis]|uniref:LADA_0F06546g1_1 n=1 Tax=Lachancea dasiensis TaxID=1072105 RepID=A0A1G4JK48_9SACH|nr:LADA_0F06546g1_1 [Lachancea dasiensis]
MDEILAKAGSQAVTFAIRSGISIASSYAIKTVATFVQKIPESDATRLQKLRQKLETRIEIVSSAIDLIKLVAAKGNTNLGSVLRLTRDLKEEIDNFDIRITAITDNYVTKKNGRDSIVAVENYIEDLLSRIEDSIPVINLSLTTSGASLSTTLPDHVSPGRLLQASEYINRNNEIFKSRGKVSQVGPTFELTMFSVFQNLASGENQARVTWKENMRKACFSIRRRTSDLREYDYSIEIKESFDDGLYHDSSEETPKSVNFDIWQVVKLFFTASGKLLKLEERNSPVLVLKVDKNLKSPSVDHRGTSTEKIEWLAFGEFENVDTRGESDSSSDSGSDSESSSFVAGQGTRDREPSLLTNEPGQSGSIALLEYIIRLASLQCNDQQSILHVHDERLSLYLNDENPNSIKYRKYNLDEVTAKLEEVKIDDSRHNT